MRSEARIDEMCNTLKRVWHLVPDWRLGQLIENLAKESHPKIKDAFYIEDDEIKKTMKIWLKEKDDINA